MEKRSGIKKKLVLDKGHFGALLLRRKIHGQHVLDEVKRLSILIRVIEK